MKDDEDIEQEIDISFDDLEEALAQTEIEAFNLQTSFEIMSDNNDDFTPEEIADITEQQALCEEDIQLFEQVLDNY